jgi:hypothetical protein
MIRGLPPASAKSFLGNLMDANLAGTIIVGFELFDIL